MDLSPGQLDLLFQALADPTRRAILARLAEGPASVSELAAPFDMALPSLLGHVRKLESAGLIATEKDGRVRTCALVPMALAPVRGWLDEQRSLWEARLDQLDEYVQSLMKDRQT
jgi:DNA-binding transcriptional ArsR family regulator